MDKRRIGSAMAALAAVFSLAIGGISVASTPFVMAGKDAPEGYMWADGLDLSAMVQGWETPKAGLSVAGKPMTIDGTTFAHGIGTHANSRMDIDLSGSAVCFMALCGVDDETDKKGSVVFQVYADGKKIADTGVMRGGDRFKSLSLDIKGAKKLRLIVTDAGDGIDHDHADWGGASFELAPGATTKPKAMPMVVETATIASGVSDNPSINGARIVGTTPGKPFVFLIPATGKAPMKFSAKGLPSGLKLDPTTGIITGSCTKAGTYEVNVQVKNTLGTAKRKLTIVAGDHKLALTPPMGWNSWNCWAGAIDDAKVRAAADWMVKSGLASHGYQYINIDDCWELERDAKGEIVPNSKFPDMKALADYVHSKGLKLGIYSSPGPKTCAGFEGSYQHEVQDANTYAKWGIDYLKYDWCGYSEIEKSRTLPALQKPYQVMDKALDECGRDIIYSLCQYGWGEVWKWGAEVGGNCWRTTGDINDSWGSMSGIGFRQDGHEVYAGPGHWNDPDMLVVGQVGWGPSLHPSRLTPNEQVTHITLWSLISAPLLIGCDMSKMDQFTMDLLGNDEVIAINQDPLGKPAGRKSQSEQTEVWARPLSDGTIAVGLFNRGEDAAKVTAKWSDVGTNGTQPVRDLWQKKDLGQYKDSFEVSVPSHGAVLIKVGKPNKID